MQHGDKHISSEAATALAQTNQITLVTSTRRNQHQQASAATNRLINGARQIMETVNGQLSEQFHIERNHAHTFWGLCTRLYSKLTAHTVSISIGSWAIRRHYRSKPSRSPTSISP